VTDCVAGSKVAIVKFEEEEDPLALTLPAIKTEQEVCYVT
jgi:hypothetical protein